LTIRNLTDMATPPDNPSEPAQHEPAERTGAEGYLPDWAQVASRRRRIVSRRNAIIAVAALVIVGFVVWINFPFIPDPVILLGRQPGTVFDSMSTGEGWTMHGRNLGQTRYASNVLDEPEGKLAWSANTGPATLAAPIASDDRIFLGAHFRIAVLDTETGQEIESMPATGPIGNSLALADGTLYYTMPDRRLVARDAGTREIRWEYQMGDATSGPVAVANGIVFAGALDGFTYAVNATTGELVWKHETPGEVRSPPAVADQLAFVASADRSLYALDARTGQERARFRTGGALAAAPVTANALAYFVSERRLFAMEADALEYPGQYAVTRTWSQLWLWGFPLPAPPSQPGDKWRFGPDYPEGFPSRQKRTEGIISAPAVAGDTLYVGDTLGKMYAVDAITGAERWQFQGEDGILVSPIVVGDLLVFGDKAGWLYGLGRAEGTEQWRLQLPAGVRTEPVYAEGQVLVRTDDGGLHAIR
jgi:outer membrane protein assembly factor BamB